MSQPSKTLRGLILIGAIALAAPLFAAPAAPKDLVIIEGPITAEDLDCKNCVKRKAIRAGAVNSKKLKDSVVTTEKIADGAVTEEKLAFGIEDFNDIAPFRELNTSGGLCDGASQGASRPVIQIDNTGVDDFVVTSILVRTSGGPFDSFLTLSIESVEINNFRFDTRTDSVIGVAGSDPPVSVSADLMGTPVLGNFSGSTRSGQGGNFPHQIVASANSDGADIEITLLCDASFNISITGIAVSGWKYEDDTVVVNYIPDL